MNEEIVIEVDRDGHVVVAVSGVQGSECKALTKGIEEAVGEVEKVTTTPEYHRTRTITRTTSR